MRTDVLAGPGPAGQRELLRGLRPHSPWRGRLLTGEDEGRGRVPSLVLELTPSGNGRSASEASVHRAGRRAQRTRRTTVVGIAQPEFRRHGRVVRRRCLARRCRHGTLPMTEPSQERARPGLSPSGRPAVAGAGGGGSAMRQLREQYPVQYRDSGSSFVPERETRPMIDAAGMMPPVVVASCSVSRPSALRSTVRA